MRRGTWTGGLSDRLDLPPESGLDTKMPLIRRDKRKTGCDDEESSGPVPPGGEERGVQLRARRGDEQATRKANPLVDATTRRGAAGSPQGSQSAGPALEDGAHGAVRASSSPMAWRVAGVEDHSPDLELPAEGGELIGGTAARRALHPCGPTRASRASAPIRSGSGPAHGHKNSTTAGPPHLPGPLAPSVRPCSTPAPNRFLARSRSGP